MSLCDISIKLKKEKCEQCDASFMMYQHHSLGSAYQQPRYNVVSGVK